MPPQRQEEQHTAATAVFPSDISLIDIIVSEDPAIRNLSLTEYCQQVLGDNTKNLLHQCDLLDQFCRHSDNLYHRVRALFFLYAIHRFHLPQKLSARSLGGGGLIPYDGYTHLLQRRFEEAIDGLADTPFGDAQAATPTGSAY